jgi:hypothetical protein
MLGVVIWGLHMSLTQGLLATFVADYGPTRTSRYAFGIVNFAGGTL